MNRPLEEYLSIPSPDVCWGGGYDSAYTAYEDELPFSFPCSRPQEDETPRYVPGADGYWWDPHAVESGRAILCCTGDLMCEPRQQRVYQYGSHYYFHPQFRFVRDILKGADLSVGNLETTLTERTPYASELHRVSGNKYHCNAPKCYLDALRYAGFDALVNANNHNCDSAVTGLVDTLDALDEYRFMHTGTFRPSGDLRYLPVKVNGIRIAILSYATYFKKLDANFTELGRQTLLNAFEPEKARADIAAAKANGAEFVLVYIHWGKEYTHSVLDSQKLYARQLADAGADYIVGSHPHTLQPRETVKAADGRIVPVLYSMGSFVTNEARRICKHTGILQLSLRRAAGRVLVEETFIPCFIYAEFRTAAYAPVPTDVMLNGGADNDTLQKAEAYIQNIMAQLPLPRTAAIDLDTVCELLAVRRPEGIPNRRFSRLCARISDIVPGCLYFGGPRNTESDWKAVARQGAAVVISDKPVDGLPCIVYPDPIPAYYRVCSALRNRFPARTVLVTGSAGKSTAMAFLSRALHTKHHTLCSPGAPSAPRTEMLTMQQLREYHDFYLQEVHRQSAASMVRLSESLQPDYAVITRTEALYESASSARDSCKSFAAVAAGLKPDGILFVNGDDAALMNAVARLERKPAQIVAFGVERPDLDYRGENIRILNGHLEMDVVYRQGRTHLSTETPVRETSYDLLAAFALALSAGIDAADIAASAASCRSTEPCGRLLEHCGVKMLLDCRCPAPSAMHAALCAFGTLAPEAGGKRVAVIGDLSGEDAASEGVHRGVGRRIADDGADYLLCCGPLSRCVYEEAIANGFPSAHAIHCPTTRALEKVLFHLLAPGDTLLISSGAEIGLNTTVRKLFGYSIG